MKVLVVGANGQIGKHLVSMIQDSKNLKARAMIRKEEQASYFEDLDAETIVADLEDNIDSIAKAAEGVDAIVFTAGSGPHTGKDKTIMVDPGHGGYDVGAISVSGHYEKDLTLTTSSLLKDTLETLGARVIMTRNSDEFIRLGSRVSLSNLINPDVFISLHYNSFPEAAYAKGISTYYYNEQDRPLAESVQKHLLLSTNADDRNALYENLQVLRHNQSQAILLELGFISNHEEESLLKTKEYQLLLVEGIISGLNEYFTKKK